MLQEEIKKNAPKKASSQIVIDSRKKISVSGVSDIESFSDTAIIAETVLGRLIIKGEGLKMSKLNIDDGVLSTDGRIDMIEYAKKKEKGAFFENLFK